MLNRLVAVLMTLGTICAGAQDHHAFSVSCDQFEGYRMCDVVFSHLPRPIVVDRISRASLELAILSDSSTDAIMTAWLGERLLTANEYSGRLTYKRSQRRIMSLDEANGVTSEVSDTPVYYVLVEDRKGLTPKDPVKNPQAHFLVLNVVFAVAPTPDSAYKAIVEEIGKHLSPGLDILASASIGDKKIRTSWHQMRDVTGKFVFAQYTHNDRTVVWRDGKMLKRFN
jgi:hypothetical protein